MTPPQKRKKAVKKITGFKMPSVQTAVTRKSSITNAFVSAIIPVIHPSPEDVKEVFDILGMDSTNVRCAYCGDTGSEWDHLRPLVVKIRECRHETIDENFTGEGT